MLGSTHQPTNKKRRKKQEKMAACKKKSINAQIHTFSYEQKQKNLENLQEQVACTYKMLVMLVRIHIN